MVEACSVLYLKFEQLLVSYEARSFVVVRLPAIDSLFHVRQEHRLVLVTVIATSNLVELPLQLGSHDVNLLNSV